MDTQEFTRKFNEARSKKQSQYLSRLNALHPFKQYLEVLHDEKLIAHWELYDNHPLIPTIIITPKGYDLTPEALKWAVSLTCTHIDDAQNLCDFAIHDTSKGGDVDLDSDVNLTTVLKGMRQPVDNDKILEALIDAVVNVENVHPAQF